MNDTHIILVAFKIFVFVVAIVNGLHASKTKKITIKTFIPIIAAYSLYAGLRWGRLIDYNIYYYNIYLPAVQYGEYPEGSEALWILFLKFFISIGASWQIIVFSMSTILICSGCFFLSNFKKYLPWLLPSFFLAIGLAENLMRWYLAFSFYLVAVSFYFKSKVKLFWIFVVGGFFIHHASVLALTLIFVILFLFRKKCINVWATSITYIILFFLFEAQVMSVFARLVETIDIGSRFLMYQDNAIEWLTGTTHDHLISKASYSNLINSLFYIFVGYYVVRKEEFDSKIVFLYNAGIVGVLLQPIGCQIELVFRIQDVMFVFRCLMLGLIFYSTIRKHKKYHFLFLCYSFLYMSYTIYNLNIQTVINLDKDKTYFIWDSNGRPALPY